MDGLRSNQPVRVSKKKQQPYVDPAVILQELYTWGPNSLLTDHELAEKAATLMFIDLAPRPSDVVSVFRIEEPSRFKSMRTVAVGGEEYRELRYFWPKEVRPRSSRRNSTSTFFSRWVRFDKTQPELLDLSTTITDYMARTTGEEYSLATIDQLLVNDSPL